MDFRRAIDRHIHAELGAQVHRAAGGGDHREALGGGRHLRRHPATHEMQPLGRFKLKQRRCLHDNAGTTRGDELHRAIFDFMHFPTQRHSHCEFLRPRALVNCGKHRFRSLPPPRSACQGQAGCGGEPACRKDQRASLNRLRGAGPGLVREPSRCIRRQRGVQIQHFHELAARCRVRAQVPVQFAQVLGCGHAIEVALNQRLQCGIGFHDDPSLPSSRLTQSSSSLRIRCSH